VKGFLAIGLILVLSGQCLLQLGYMAWFESHREEIAVTKCENLDKPELACNGRCHMVKILEKLDDTRPEAPIESKNEMTGFPLFVIPVFEWISPDFAILNATHSELKNTFRPQGFAGDIFRPPRG